MQKKGPSLLIVDDEAINTVVLLEVLADDYTVRVATDSVSALDSVAKAPPDLILLDVMMPGIDGFEVCRLLKDDPALREIPIIFITALNDNADEARGLKLGAVDYITKPFNPGIVKIRVQNHLELKAHRDHLAALVAERTSDLEALYNRLKALNAIQSNYLKAISDDLLRPMTGLLDISEAAFERLDDHTLTEFRGYYQRSRDRILLTVDSAMLLNMMQGSGTSPMTGCLDLNEVIAVAWDSSLQKAYSARDLSLTISRDKSWAVIGNESLICESIATVLEIAQKMAEKNTDVTATMYYERECTILAISFQCTDLPDNMHKNFFDTFSHDATASPVAELGPAVPRAALFVRAMGGSINYYQTPSGAEVRLSMLTYNEGNVDKQPEVT